MQKFVALLENLQSKNKEVDSSLWKSIRVIEKHIV